MKFPISPNSLLFHDTDKWSIQFFRYTIVGGLAFVADYSLLFVLTEYLGLHYLVSATISFIVGLTINYILSIFWIFRHSKLESRIIEFIIYGIIGVIGLFINNAMLYLLTDYVSLYYMLSKLITAAVVMGWNFVGRKLILFNN